MLKEIWMSNPAMTAPTSGFSEIGLNFRLSRVQLSSVGIESGCNKCISVRSKPTTQPTNSIINQPVCSVGETQFSGPTWSWEFSAAVTLTEEGIVWGFLQEDGLGILEENIGQQNIIEREVWGESNYNR